MIVTVTANNQICVSSIYGPITALNEYVESEYIAGFYSTPYYSVNNQSVSVNGIILCENFMYEIEIYRGMNGDKVKLKKLYAGNKLSLRTLGIKCPNECYVYNESNMVGCIFVSGVQFIRMYNPISEISPRYYSDNYYYDTEQMIIVLAMGDTYEVHKLLTLRPLVFINDAIVYYYNERKNKMVALHNYDADNYIMQRQVKSARSN